MIDQRLSAMPPINVHWWKDTERKRPNLGDELSSIVLDEIFSVNHQHSDIQNADLVSTGSILNMIFRYFVEGGELQKGVGVVGSGFMHPHLNLYRFPKLFEYLRFYSVRGYLTLQLLPQPIQRGVTIGDPGLLAPKVYQATQAKPQNRYGVILHHSQEIDDNLRGLLGSLESFELIDFKTDNLRSVVDQMLDCEIIISQGLHGLIIADAYGIPNVWFDYGELHVGGAFKFYDYFSSVGRPFFKKVSASIGLNPDSLSAAAYKPNPLRINRLQSGIHAAYQRFFKNRIAQNS